MNKSANTAGLIVLALCLGASVPGPARAEDGESAGEAAQMQALMAARTSALQAGQAAEARVGGKTSHIEFKLSEGQPVYEIEVVKPDGKAEDVTVDAGSGEIVKTAADRPDETADDGEHDEKDDDNS